MVYLVTLFLEKQKSKTITTWQDIIIPSLLKGGNKYILLGILNIKVTKGLLFHK